MSRKHGVYMLLLLCILLWVPQTTAVTMMDADACPSGTEAVLVSEEGAAVCIPCRVGTYREQGQQDNCERCPDGFITLEVGAGRSANCDEPIGARDDCPSGYAWVGFMESCVICPANTYRTLGWDYWCMPCPEGTESTTGALSITQCTATDICPAGTEWVEETEWCEPCQRNYFRSQEMSPVCFRCPERHITLFIGATSQFHCMPEPNHELAFSQEDCPSGTEFDEETNACYLCERNYYRRAGQQETCQRCPDGLETLYEGAVDAELCVTSHQIVDILNTLFIVTTPQCPLGTEWVAHPGACVRCPIGTYRDTAGQRLCQSCPYDQITPVEGALVQAQCGAMVAIEGQVYEEGSCEPGMHWSDSVQGCVLCPHGLYSMDGIMCTTCPSGTTTPYAGAISENACTLPSAPDVPVPFFGSDQCPSGSEWDGALQACVSCPVGFYRSNQPVCQPCPDGFTTLSAGTKQDDLCFVPAHGPAFLPGASSGCPVGYGGVSQDWCQPCAPFTYKETADGSECRACPVSAADLESLYTNPPTAVSSAQDCPPMITILSFSPTYGPQSGGTIVHLELDLSTSRDVRVLDVTIGEYSCLPFSLYIRGGILSCATAPIRHLPVSSPVVLVTEGGLQVTSSDSFTYRPDPVIESLDRASSITSGWVKILGENMDSVPDATLLLFPMHMNTYADSVPIQWPCQAESSTVLKCISDAPVGGSRRRRGTRVASRQRRDTSAANEYRLGLLMDGVGQYADLGSTLPEYSTLAVYPDPEVNLLEDDPTVVSAGEPILRINGARLQEGVLESDITVRIGDCQGQLVSVTATQIQVSVCTDMDVEEEYPVEVHIGTLTFSVGAVVLEVDVMDVAGEEDNPILLPLLIAVAVLIIVLIILGVLLFFFIRIKKPHRKLAPTPSSSSANKQGSVHETDVTDDAHLPPMPVNSVFGHERVTDRGVSMRQLALPEDGTLTVHLVEPSSRKNLMRYHIPESSHPNATQDGTT